MSVYPLASAHLHVCTEVQAVIRGHRLAFVSMPSSSSSSSSTSSSSSSSSDEAAPVPPSVSDPGQAVEHGAGMQPRQGQDKAKRAHRRAYS
eukprot:4020166-Karenia_brevis.AAC.1